MSATQMSTLKNLVNFRNTEVLSPKYRTMSSTFDEFQFMINQTNFDVIALSETWMKNDKHVLEYVKLPGFEFAYRIRDKKSGGGVGFISEIDRIQGNQKLDDETKLDELIEHLWVKIQGRKKNCGCLIGIFYQPSSGNNKKIEWTEKLDPVLTVVKSTWNGTS